LTVSFFSAFSAPTNPPATACIAALYSLHSLHRLGASACTVLVRLHCFGAVSPTLPSKPGGDVQDFIIIIVPA